MCMASTSLWRLSVSLGLSCTPTLAESQDLGRNALAQGQSRRSHGFLGVRSCFLLERELQTTHYPDAPLPQAFRTSAPQFPKADVNMGQSSSTFTPCPLPSHPGAAGPTTSHLTPGRQPYSTVTEQGLPRPPPGAGNPLLPQFQ